MKRSTINSQQSTTEEQRSTIDREPEPGLNHLLGQTDHVETDGRPAKFSDLKGVWSGLDLSFEEIQAAEYTLPDLH